ncbi:MAG: Type 1 glutamine amidotransferase-like domain-containing protein [Carbonactinosporaceae bacterium]
MNAEAKPQILATSGGLVPVEGGGPFHWRFGSLMHHAIELAGRPDRPRFCYVGTAGGDSLESLVAMSRALTGTGVRLSRLELFPQPSVRDIRAHLLDQHVVWVGGGSVANLLAVWRVHGLDVVFREIWQAGVVLAGTSAGSLCWHAGGTTDSFGPQLRGFTNGLGLLPYSNCVHYDTEEQRRPLFQRLVADGTLPGGYATDDGVGLHYVGTQLVEAVSDRPGAAAYVVAADGTGAATEQRIAPRRLS